MRDTFLGDQLDFFVGISHVVSVISYLALPSHALQAVYVWLKSVNNEGQFTSTTTYRSYCISRSFPRILLKLDTALFLRMSFDRCKFCLNRPVIKSTLLGDQSNVSSTSRFPLEGCNYDFILHIDSVGATNTTSLVAMGKKKGHFNWGAKYLFFCIWPSVRHIFLKLHTTFLLRMPYKRKFSSLSLEPSRN
jgi:hypothetical protein